QVLDYYDGNTVTALWNYAQHFSMNDNSFSTQFGPSTPGALNLTVGNTFGVNCGSSNEANPTVAAPCLNRYAPGDPNDKTAQGTSTVFGDPQPAYDICSTRDNVGLGGKNIGNLLNDAGVTWGWFNGGFRVTADNPATPQPTNPFGLPAFCIQSHRANGGVSNGTSSTSNDQALTGAPLKTDYIPHHEPFQYFKSTSNPMHLAPASVAEIGHNGAANHQYDLTDFWTAVDHGNMPAVSFLKARAFQDGHAQYSTPLDEQRFLVQTINRLQRSPFWHSTAVVVNYDDSDGWYDHVASPISIQSQSTFDALTGVDCGTRAKNTPPTKTGATTPQETRCGYGPRQPFVLISPWARTNFVDNTLTDQASITRFIEDNWLDKLRIGQGSADAIAGPITNMLSSTGPHAGRLFLNPVTGQPSEDEGDNRQE
ncbi:MAG TPA: alkaline phosphatase family protein, partial [Candidatus Dormibacteraeota bacterium]|nr:alkaline phosphatase family protein [Candidatus Dormibacteraeota bacterium]